jgi:DNA invertase Pin-like site-specific DNA recombinase
MARQRGVKFGRPRKLGTPERERIVKRRAAVELYAHIAQVYGVSQSTVLRALGQ